MGRELYYEQIVTLQCPFCNQVLEPDWTTGDGVWICPDEEACGYEEKNNITMCHGLNSECGTSVLSKSGQFETPEELYCAICLSEGIELPVSEQEEPEFICVECGGQLMKEKELVSCLDCGLILSDENRLQILHRMRLVHSKKDLPS